MDYDADHDGVVIPLYNRYGGVCNYGGIDCSRDTSRCGAIACFYWLFVDLGFLLELLRVVRRKIF